MDRRSALTALFTAGILPLVSGGLYGHQRASATSKRTVLLSAVGDGLSDDGPAFRSALSSARAGDTIIGESNKVYRIASWVAVSTFVMPARVGGANIGMIIPRGVTLDLRGATMICDMDNVVLITNQAAAQNSQDSDVGGGLINARIDGGGVIRRRQASTGCLVQLTRLQGFTIEVELVNVRHSGLFMYDCDNIKSRSLVASNVVGQAFALGYPLSGKGVRGSYFAQITTMHSSADQADVFNFPGNGLYCELQNSSVGRIHSRECSAGIKLGKTCRDVTIGDVCIEGGNGGANSGVKLQGTPTEGPTRIVIGTVSASSQSGHGLYLEYTRACKIGAYVGENNQRDVRSHDVWLGGFGDSVNTLTSNFSGGVGVYVRPYCRDIKVKVMSVTNPGPSGSVKMDLADGVVVMGNEFVVSELAVVDRRSRPGMRHALVLGRQCVNISLPSVVLGGSAQALVSSDRTKFRQVISSSKRGLLTGRVLQIH